MQWLSSKAPFKRAMPHWLGPMKDEYLVCQGIKVVLYLYGLFLLIPLVLVLVLQCNIVLATSLPLTAGPVLQCSTGPNAMANEIVGTKESCNNAQLVSHKMFYFAKLLFPLPECPIG